MVNEAPRFGLNHIIAPNLAPLDFFKLAKSLGITDVEIRNDLPATASLLSFPPEAMRDFAAEAGVSILSINGLQRFNDWNKAREDEAIALAEYARAAKIKALVLVPTNDGSGTEDGARQKRLAEALAALKPILVSRGILGFVEPLGFTSSSLRFKSEAIAAIEAVDGAQTFGLVHDTFHHRIAGDKTLFPAQTRLVHLSGVTGTELPFEALRDDHRVMVDSADVLGNVDQVRQLRESGFRGVYSFEPFSPAVQASDNVAGLIKASMRHVSDQLAL